MQNTHVLLVEDEVLIAHQLKKKLHQFGCEKVEIASNSEDAFQILKSHKIDIVMMDIVIKGDLDGIETTKIINKEFDIPVVFLTAYADDETLKRVEETHAYGYIVKPFQEREVLAMIKLSMQRHKKDQELVQTVSKMNALGKQMNQATERLVFQVGGANDSDLDMQIQNAITKKQFEVYYQPQIEILTGKIVGAEALVRWNHPTRGLLMPINFIPQSEANGLINDIGSWVLATACEHLYLWQKVFSKSIKLGINISTLQVQNHDVVKQVEGLIKRYHLKPKTIDFEITESIVLENSQIERDVLKALKELGCILSVDDFGMGYSSLGYLQDFPFDILKIDRHFVKNITTNSDHHAITKAIIEMAHNLKLTTVAEGVESSAELDYLKDNGCDLMQGYLFSPAVPAIEFTELLKTDKRFLVDGDSE